MASAHFLTRLRDILLLALEGTPEEYISSKVTEFLNGEILDSNALLLLIYNDPNRRRNEEDIFFENIRMEDYFEAFTEERPNFERIRADNQRNELLQLREQTRRQEENIARIVSEQKDQQEQQRKLKEEQAKEKKEKDDKAKLERKVDIIIPSGKIIGYLFLVVVFQSKSYVSSLITQGTSWVDKLEKIRNSGAAWNFTAKCLYYAGLLIWLLVDLPSPSDFIIKAIITSIIEFICEGIVFWMKRKQEYTIKFLDFVERKIFCCFSSESENNQPLQVHPEAGNHGA